MSKRLNKINEKDVDEFNEAEENQNTKRKTELDVNLIYSYIATEAVSHVNGLRAWKNVCRISFVAVRTFVEYRLNCKYFSNIVIKWHFVLKLYCLCLILT